jgi:hypothetical protein
VKPTLLASHGHEVINLAFEEVQSAHPLLLNRWLFA